VFAAVRLDAQGRHDRVLSGFDRVDEDARRSRPLRSRPISSRSLREVPTTNRREIDERVVALGFTPTGSSPAP
jgi:hypothetical protein